MKKYARQLSPKQLGALAKSAPKAKGRRKKASVEKRIAHGLDGVEPAGAAKPSPKLRARLLSQSKKIFGKGAAEWLKTPQVGLGGEIPLIKGRTEPGARQVETLLRRIDYGVA